MALRDRARRPQGDDPVARLVRGVARAVDYQDWRRTLQERVRETEAFADLRQREPEEQIEAIIGALAEARGHVDGHVEACDHTVASELLRRNLPWTEESAGRLVEQLVRRGRSHGHLHTSYGPPISGVLRALERAFADDGLPRSLHAPLRELRTRLSRDADAADRKAVRRIDLLVGDAEPTVLPRLDDPWSGAVLELHERADGEEQDLAARVLALAATAASTKPTREFKTARAELVDAASAERVGALVGAMLEAAARSVSPAKADRQVPPEAGDLLRGLAWIAEAADTDDAARGAAAMAIAGWQKVPYYGPLSRKAASAAIAALAAMPEHGAQHLGRVRAKLKQASAVADVDKAIDVASERLGIPRAEFEERVVPTFDLAPGEGLRKVLGEHTAELSLGPQLKATLTFTNASGKRLKSVPAAVKEHFPTELAELKRTAKDVTTMAQAQRLRLERLLLEERDWPLGRWRERYLDHPLVAPVARRLIWNVGDRSAIWHEGRLVDAGGEAVLTADDDRIALWHPVLAVADEVLAWRRFLEERQVTQPFKQAHREVYLVTDAERQTGVYSNRFAAHVLRQHQFAALARGRGWRYALQGPFDAPDEHATLRLPQYGLTVSFWVERPWGDDRDWSDGGIFNHVLTDQVRFDDGRGVLRLEDVPVRAFSEAMRDVDLFVGVASIGNDPAWDDTGRDRRWNRYWHDYSFGELSEQAETRRDLLGRLLPKLKIAPVARLEDRFLVVEGNVRTYKIHLGSGNILMSPNDEYLCIVPGRGERKDGEVFLPFEGDGLLSIILSKAMLLAADDRIEDRTILSQIRRW